MNVLPHYFAIPIISSLVIMNSLAAEKTLFDFHTRTNSAAWQVVNDDVMGGVSTCSFTVTNDVAIFRGEISLENNGGFASARSLPTRQDLANCDAFVIRVRGDGHRYKFAELHALSIEYNHSTIAAIHFNPGTDKTRGHLGSQLERKAETNLKLERDGDAFVVWGDKTERH